MFRRGLPSHTAPLLLLAALWLLAVHASRSQIDLWGDFTSSELAPRSEEKVTNNVKNVVFIRHAQSAGNAKMLGAFEMGRWDAYKDGMLTKKGTTAIENEVADLVNVERGLIKDVLRSDIVLVSPLRRAMATAIIFLAKAKQLLRDADWSDDLTIEITDTNSLEFAAAQSPNSAADLLPEIRVHADLREKYSTESDKPGTDDTEHPLQYVHRIAKQYGTDLFMDEQALDTTYQQMRESYLAEENRTNGWKPDAVNGYTFADQIRNFKNYLKGIVHRNVLIVGHNGWSRFAFASYLPVSGNENIERNMRFGTREVRPLRNLGIIKATFDNGIFTGATVREQDVAGSGKWAILVSREEALGTGVVPAGSGFEQIMVWKKKTITLMGSPYIRLILTFATTAEGVRTLAWTDKWGKIHNADRDCYEIGQQRQLYVNQTQLAPDISFDLIVGGSKVFSFMVESQRAVSQLQRLVHPVGLLYLLST